MHYFAAIYGVFALLTPKGAALIRRHSLLRRLCHVTACLVMTMVFIRLVDEST